jgi:predicted nucleic acid-binding protein
LVDVDPAAHIRRKDIAGDGDIFLKWRLLMEDGRKTGHTYSHPDLLLAATALHHGLTVVTRDRSDFDKARVPVLNPWETT